ncbi:spermatogenesis-associated protein 2 [Ornithorhynchus anatinus]|uniref:Spermatogenesis-associated protein 2 n=1 Tax=Ornithorhynchus anatinus TaxID=9258 RepID=A0A6I8ND12_ORNAN|nr:spermatogenesis-associated protein 2 [Ornithorhynchus anatinus]
MEARYKDDLFRKYVQFHEARADGADPGGRRRGASGDEGLRGAASALLSLQQVEPPARFRLLQFYEVAEGSLRGLRSSNLRALRGAFGLLETLGINLFLYPWKKEFRSIKTYTGPFVYHIKSTLPEEAVRGILSSLGYVPELGTAYRLRDLVETLRVQMVSFELFLAKVECEQLLEIHSQVKEKGYSELDVVAERKRSKEDVRGCSDAMRRRAEGRETPSAASAARVVLQKSASERAAKDYFKPRVGKASKSVDAYDGGPWEARKAPPPGWPGPREEPAPAGDPEAQPGRPPPSLAAGPGRPDEPAPAPCRPGPPPPEEPDLYTAPDPRGAPGFRRQDALKPDIWLPANEPGPVYRPKRGPAACQACGLPGPGPCPRCDGAALKANGGAGRPRPAPRDKPPPAPGPARPRPVGSSSRCSFCNRPGAANTCTFCSKVSCDACLGAYHYDPCCRKSALHRFLPSHQLGAKSVQLSHLVYR